MNSEQKYFLLHGLTTFFMISTTYLIHSILEADVFILALGWAGMFFMSEYFWRVSLSPLTRDIGRLEGERIALKKIKKRLEETKCLKKVLA